MKSIVILTLLSTVLVTALAQNKDTRGGTCEQTKMQYDHYCSKKGDPTKDEIFTTANIACNNAKRNMAAACDGSSEKDMPYGFDQNGTPVGDLIQKKSNQSLLGSSKNFALKKSCFYRLAALLQTTL